MASFTVHVYISSPINNFLRSPPLRSPQPLERAAMLVQLCSNNSTSQIFTYTSQKEIKHVPSGLSVDVGTGLLFSAADSSNNNPPTLHLRLFQAQQTMGIPHELLDCFGRRAERVLGSDSRVGLRISGTQCVDLGVRVERG